MHTREYFHRACWILFIVFLKYFPKNNCTLFSNKVWKEDVNVSEKHDENDKCLTCLNKVLIESLRCLVILSVCLSSLFAFKCRDFFFFSFGGDRCDKPETIVANQMKVR